MRAGRIHLTASHPATHNKSLCKMSCSRNHLQKHLSDTPDHLSACTSPKPSLKENFFHCHSRLKSECSQFSPVIFRPKREPP